MISRSAPFDPLPGLLLMGGRSVRFGRDKMVAQVDNKPLWVHALQSLDSVSSSVRIANGHGESLIVPDTLRELEGVADQFIDAGPLAGIHAALETTEADALVVLAADVPRVSNPSWRRVFETFHEGLSDIVCAVSPSGRIQPLCGIWSSALHSRLGTFLQSGKRSVQGFLDDVQFETCELPESELLNINLPSDLDLLTQM